MHRLVLRSLLVGGLAACAGFTACLDDNSQTKEVVGPTDVTPIDITGLDVMTFDEELFGRVTTSDSAGWWAFLSPGSNLPTGATDSVPLHFGYPGSSRDWGWFDVSATDGGCQPNGVASSAETRRWSRLDQAADVPVVILQPQPS
jgi:hypothetical protein